MKANEIQIGDWVYSTFSKLPCRVTYLKLHESGYASVETTNVVEVKDIASLSPIPLTPEILEKNGFKNGKFNVSPQYYLEDNDVFMGVTLKDIPDKHKGIDIAKGKLYFQYDISHIEEPIYVHQLQQALRLCGIEKEIIL